MCECLLGFHLHTKSYLINFEYIAHTTSSKYLPLNLRYNIAPKHMALLTTWTNCLNMTITRIKFSAIFTNFFVVDVVIWIAGIAHHFATGRLTSSTNWFYIFLLKRLLNFFCHCNCKNRVGQPTNLSILENYAKKVKVFVKFHKILKNLIQIP